MTEKLPTINLKGKELSDNHKKSIKKSMINFWDKKGRKGTIQLNGYKTIGSRSRRQYEHRMIMEKTIGRKLEKYEQVHHVNGNKLDNHIDNLQIINFKEHQKLHAHKNSLGKDRKGISPINKTNPNTIKLIKKLRAKGWLLKDICKIINISIPTIIKYIYE